MNDQKLRDKIAAFLQKKVEEKTEIDYVPGASSEVQKYISYVSFLEIADALIPMVKQEINSKKKAKIIKTI